MVPSANPGSLGDHLYGVEAVAPDDVWAVGQQVGATAPEQELIEHWDGSAWSVVPSAGHGTASGMLFGVAAAGDTVWAVGLYDTGGNRLTLAQRHQEP